MKFSLTTQIMQKVGAFPGMPGAAAKLLAMLENSQTSIVQMEEVLRYDPGLTANLLRLTNSAYFGMPSKIGSVKQAMMLLGTKKLTQLVITSCVSAMMNQPVPGYGLEPGELWRHSMAVSIAAELLVRELKVDQEDEIFTAALLHDVGKLVLGAFVNDDYRKIEAEAARGISFEIAEQRILGTDHAKIGALILKKWSLPESLVHAVRYHHHPDAGDKSSNMIDIVHVANVLCLMIGIGVGREGLRYEPWKSATKRLGLHPRHLESVASRTVQHVDELSEILEVK